MLICTDCDRTSADDEVHSVREPHGEVVDVCPYCGSSDMVDAARCDGCGGYFAAEYMDDGWCDNCKAEVQKDLQVLINDYLVGKPTSIRELVNSIYDGVDIC